MKSGAWGAGTDGPLKRRYDCGMRPPAIQDSDPSLPPDPVIEAYKRDVDRTLLLENLKKTPDERVRALVALQRLAREAREAGKLSRGH